MKYFIKRTYLAAFQWHYLGVLSTADHRVIFGDGLQALLAEVTFTIPADRTKISRLPI